MALNNPQVGAKGLWKLKDPFASYLPTNTVLTCTAVSNYAQVIAMGLDPYELHYKTRSISETIYQEHMRNEGRIIFVRSDAGKRYSFPLHYLESYPVGTGVSYCSMGIGIRLGALPIDKNIEFLIQQYQELANLNLGVDIHADFQALSEIFIVDNATHDRLEKARKEKKKAQVPALEKILDLTNKANNVQTKLTLAERKLIEQHNRILLMEAEIRRLGGNIPP